MVSASRATDIPAFHAAWLMDRLAAGYCEWQNPFNARQKQLVSFKDTEIIVFWSKNPGPLAPYLEQIEDLGKKFYFQFTLNNYELAGLEPGIPELDDRIKTFISLAQKYRVIWRYDPVILGGSLTINRHLQMIKSLMLAIGPYTGKLVFSFVDLYSRVAGSLARHNQVLRRPNMAEIAQFATELAELKDKFAPNLRLASCAEAEMDFQSLGIEKNSCIDAALINELCGHELCRQKRPGNTYSQLSLLAAPEANIQKAKYEKDKGQRPACQCAPSKDIGSYQSHACKHRCVYCYAGHASKAG